MNEQMIHRRKLVIVGAGAVGSTFCYALAQSGLADEIALIDNNQNLVKGQVLDLVHGQPFFPTVSIYEGSQSDYADAKVIVITAGAAQRPGETRLQLLQKNASITRSIMNDIVGQKSQAVVIVVNNPVDIMTYVAQESVDWKKGRIIGAGTVLDSARLRYFLSDHCGVDVHNVHGYVLGEHGDSEFVAWSMTNIAGMQMDSYCPACQRCHDWLNERNEIEQKVRDSAYHIIDYKGATWFAVGLALVRIASAILRGQKSVLTISTRLDGEFGLSDVCLSVPAIVSGNGVERIIESTLPEAEARSLASSAAVLRNAIEELDG
ncbi:MAG: L-lactate dehydrogenase [candidate division KSB1 bacterium]|nr:L-lactate dehydrogenase [candidate division KSB1 bacterium]